MIVFVEAPPMFGVKFPSNTKRKHQFSQRHARLFAYVVALHTPKFIILDCLFEPYQTRLICGEV